MRLKRCDIGGGVTRSASGLCVARQCDGCAHLLTDRPAHVVCAGLQRFLQRAQISQTFGLGAQRKAGKGAFGGGDGMVNICGTAQSDGAELRLRGGVHNWEGLAALPCDPRAVDVMFIDCDHAVLISVHLAATSRRPRSSSTLRAWRKHSSDWGTPQ